MGQKLFDDGDSDGAEDISKIEIDQEFARRFEHNKRREDLHRLEELKKRGEISDSSDDDSSEEEEDEEEIAGSKKTDLKFYDAIVRVKRNDPAIYQKDANLYSSSSEEEEEEEGKIKKKKNKKEKPLYMKDVVAKHLLEEGPEYGEEQTSKSAEPRSKSYLEEQEENRRAFLEAAGETLGSDGEDLFLEKKRSSGEAVDDEEGEIHNRLDEVFGEDENLDQNDAFLKNFFLNKMWLEKSKDPAEEDLVAVSEEEEEIVKQEKYEADFNFRYQEGVGDRVLGHSRVIEGTVRKKTNARKLQRKSKEERMSQAEIERKEELKRLKNIKKKEIQEKLEKIRKIAGITESAECALDEADLDEDFDPEEYDRKMKKVFDADYYDAEDADPEFDDEVAKPNFDEEDELLGLPKDWIKSNSSDGFLAARSKIAEQEEEVEEEAEPQSESKRKRKRKISLHEKVDLEKALEEYYKLDYEDTIGDLKTRFKYKSVPSNRFGLSAEEILMADDKELNQYVSLKKIAPYREEEWKVSRQKRYHQKIKKKLLLGNEEDDKDKREKKKKKKREKEDSGSEKHSKDEQENKEKKKKKRENNDGGAEEGDSKDEMSRRSKRRRRQRELKLSQSRLAAYGKIPQKLK